MWHNMEGLTMKELAIAVHRYAPKLDEVDKVKFCMYLMNKYGLDDLQNLNLANEWQAYNN